MTKKVKRLFEQLAPSNYQLHINIDEESLKFTGEVAISARIKGRPRRRITLHQKDLKILSATVTHKDKKGNQKDLHVDRVNTHSAYDEVRIHTKDMIYPGEVVVTLKFSGKITASMHGIYPCNYKHNGTDKKLIATQFESHYAREAFPCVDEPEAKATFDLAVTADVKSTVLSNTDPKGVTTKSGRQTVTFNTTPIMSSYLLAFVTGEMIHVEGKAKSGVIVRSWATVAQEKSFLNYANDEAVKVLDFFEDYFKTPFPLPKCDQVALPDFESMAMENWGLITFREVGLLADPINRSISSEQLISLVIAHEMSHQWFGNLVTMKWWDDLWLNESFASLMEHLALDTLHPDWHEWESFTASRVISASNRDIYKDVQPVGVTVNHPDEIVTLFDPSIVYAKGARLLKMLHDYIGEEAFRSALQSYFKKHAYKNTTREDLWAEMSESTGKDIEKLMTPWLIQSGTPMLSVQRKDNELELSQKRFLLDGEDDKSLWQIPLLANAELPIDTLDSKTKTIKITNSDSLLFNRTGSGHFITNYKDQSSRDLLAKSIVGRSIDSSTRIIAINDMMRLAEKGEISVVELLKIATQCGQEDRDAVWSMVCRVLSYSHLLIEGDEKYEDKIRAQKAKLADYWYEKLGWQDQKDDDVNTKHIRTTALALKLAGRDPEATKKALALFDKIGSAEGLPADQRTMIICAVVRSKNAKAIDSLIKEYETTLSSDVKDSIAAGLCATHDTKVAEKIISWGLSDEGVVRDQDIDHFFAYMMRNSHIRDVAWEWFTTDYDRLAKKFGNGKRLEFFIWYGSHPLSTREWQKKFTDFFTPKLNQVALSRNLNIAFSEIEARVQWRERDEKKIKQFLG